MAEVMYDPILGRLREGEDGGGGGESTPKIITVANLYAITAEELESLKAGDIVVVDNGTIQYPCVVTATRSTAVFFYYVYADTNEVNRVKFSKSGGTWSYTRRRFPIVIAQETIQPVNGMEPNKVYALGELTGDTTFAMAAATDNDMANVWHWTFETPATAPKITWPAQITIWQGGAQPTIKANTHYDIKVLGGFASYTSTDNPLADKADKTIVVDFAGNIFSEILENNKIFNCGELEEIFIDVDPLVVTSASYICQLNFTSGATPTESTFSNDILVSGDDVDANGDFIPEANRRYIVKFYTNGVQTLAIVQGVDYNPI